MPVSVTFYEPSPSEQNQESEERLLDCTDSSEVRHPILFVNAMAKGKNGNDQTLTHPKLPRIISSSSRSLEYSSPAPGRPMILWVEGINPGIVRELWDSQEEVPYGCRIGVTRKMIVYERTHPEIRLVLFLDTPYDREGETWQPIVQSRVERDRGVDPRQSRSHEERLWDEVCRVERRGRPRGTGHPKNKILQEFPISSTYITRLRREGLVDKDLRILFGRCGNKTFKQIGRELGISAQAAWKRWKRRIQPAIKRVNPKFSSTSFKMISLDSK
jgi:hypothetical protein